MASNKLSIEQLKKLRDKEAKALVGKRPKTKKKLTEREILIMDIKRLRKARLQKTLQRTGNKIAKAGRFGIKALDFLDDITTKPEKRLKKVKARKRARKAAAKRRASGSF